MAGAAVFTAVYATAVVMAALGLDRIGAVSAHRRPGGARDESDNSIPWQHLGSMTVHTVVAAVAVAAALLVSLVMAIRYPSPGDALLLAIPTLLSLAVLRRFYRRLRTATQGDMQW